MNKISILIASCLVPLGSAIALADDAPGPANPPPLYGYGHMWGRGMGDGAGWGDGWGYGSGMPFFFHPFVMILALIGLVVVVMWLVRLVSHGSLARLTPDGVSAGHDRGRALGILAERLAKGEIGKDEFEEKKKLIQG